MAYNFQVPLLSMSVNSYFLIPAIVCGFHRSIGNNQLESRTISKGTLGFIRVLENLENLESPGIYSGIFQDWKVLEKATTGPGSSRNLLNSTNRLKRQFLNLLMVAIKPHFVQRCRVMRFNALYE